MVLEELERLAALDKEMPETDMTLPEQWLFITLREIYRRYRAGAISKELGHREKQHVMVAYRSMLSDYNTMIFHREIHHRLQREIGVLHKCECEHCRKVIRVLDGVERVDIPEDARELHSQNERLRELVKERSDRAAELRTVIDRIGWVLDGEGSAEAKTERIKEIINT